MSTNAIIGKLQANGTVRSIYLQHDGYFSYARDASCALFTVRKNASMPCLLWEI
ncbi:MAG: hypothetical protein ACLR8Y_16335 [Alistipes indistinctus]